MKINFQRLIAEYNLHDKLTQADLAREMVAKGFFSSMASAKNMINKHQRGLQPTYDKKLLVFLQDKFSKTVCEILND